MKTDSTHADSSSFDKYIDGLVAAVADRMAIDWSDADAHIATAGDADRVEQLRLLADMAAVFGLADDDSAPRQDDTQQSDDEYLPRALVTLTGDRYVYGERLGTGGFGVVYKAFDRERKVHVALKTFTHAGVESAREFKREFRMLAHLNHPNLVSFYELYGDQSWLIAMELVDGVDFLSYVREGHGSAPATEGLGSAPATAGAGSVTATEDPQPIACDLPRLGQALTQLAQALAYLHGEGKLHCDIKPSNVLVTTDGQVKVVDFGLVIDLSQEADPAANVRGTPAYVSPEQSTGQRPTAASDWYGVGVMLYEALTGERPFHGTISEVLNAKQQLAAPLEALSGDIPEAIRSLCRQLLLRDPHARPSDEEVLQALHEIWPAVPASLRPITSRADHGPFVGREAELALLERAFDASLRGTLQTVSVHGASGMGKSVLIRHFVDTLRARRSDVVILEGRCSERESVPYKALDSLIDQLADYLITLSLDEEWVVLPQDCGTLARLFPSLRRVPGVELRYRSSRTADAQEMRRRGRVALRELLARMADRHALVLVIDDLQWTDADSAALLDDLLFGDETPPLLFVGCYRTEEGAGNAALRTLLSTAQAAQLRGHGIVHTVGVGELPNAEARELARALIHAHGDDRSVDAIVEESGCSPLFIHQLVQYAAHTAPPGASSVTDERSERTDLSTLTLDSVIRARTASFGDGARRLLQVLAVFGGPLDLSLASDVAEVGPAALNDSVALRTARLARARIAGQQEKLEVYHDRIREAIVGDIPVPELMALHGRLATALEQVPGTDPDTLVHHFDGAGRRDTAATYAVIAGDRAGNALAFDRAVRSYQFALEFGRFDNGGRTVRAKLGDALAAGGRGYGAAKAYLQAASDSSPGDALDLQRRAAEQLLQSGHLDDGLSVVEDVLRRSGLRLPATPRRALLSLVLLRARIVLRRFRFSERAEKDIAVEDLVRVDTCWSVTTGLAIVDHIRAAEVGARNLLLALQAGEPLRIVRALAMELAYTSISGAASQPQNERLIALAEPLTARITSAEGRALLTLAKGSAAYMQGKWPAARELCEKAQQTLREECTRVAWHIDTAQFYTLLSLLYLGEIGELSQRLPGLLKEAIDRDAVYAETILRTRLSYLTCLAQDDLDAATRAVSEGMQRWSHQGFHNQHYYEMVATAETQLYAGRGADAWAGLTRKWVDLRRTLLLRVQPVRIESTHLRARTAIACALDTTSSAQREKLIRAAEKDAADLRHTGAPWARGLAELMCSGASTLRGARTKAMAHVEAAEAIFERERMGLYLAVARRRRGELLGDEGGALVESANAWMRDQTIANPDAFAQMLAPGDFAGRPATRFRESGEAQIESVRERT